MFVYMLLCADGTIYTGAARDLEKRMRDHFEKRPSAAAYTRAKGAAYLLAAWECETYSGALRAEAAIKRLKRAEKEMLIQGEISLTYDKFPSLREENFTKLPDDDPRVLAIRAAYPRPECKKGTSD